MRWKNLIRATRLALALSLLFLLPSCRRNDEAASTPKIRGELIEAAATETPTNEPPKRKHPKPPSVQRRMVLAELALLTQSNSDTASMASGTLGNAADLAKTNLPSITSMALPGLNIPGYRTVTFNALSDFDFALTSDASSATARSQIPASVQSLDNNKIAIQGFLLPVKMNDGLAVEFLLMRNQSMCCYGVPPKINEWITVQVSGKGVKPIMDQPIAVAGLLRVGPMEENGSLAGIYRLDADKVITPF